MNSAGGAIADILLIDDNPGDIRLVEEAMKEAQFHNDLYTVDEHEAREFVQGEGGFEDVPRPDLVLLDLHLRATDGEDVLHELKCRPELGAPPVVVLTGMDDDYVESKDLDHDADEDAVLSKPLDVDEFLEVVRELDGLKISIVSA